MNEILPAGRCQRLVTPAVLSIGKLSAGQAKYYLEQGEARVDAVESIGDGVEEYYAGGAEARGSWIGSAGAALGLSGLVDGDALRRVLAGLIRWMGRRCGIRRVRCGSPALT